MKHAHYDYVVSPLFSYGDGLIWELKRLTLGFGTRYLVFTGVGPITEYVHNAIAKSLSSPADAFVREHSNAIGRKMPLQCDLPVPDIDSVPIEYRIVDIEGWQVTLPNIKKVAQEIRDFQPDVVVGVGGGKTFDNVRAATYYGDIYHRPKIVLMPTVVAANPAATPMSIIYNDDGTDIIGLWNLATPMEAVILDTELAVQAPPHTLAAAIGDTLSVAYEASHVWDELGIREELDPIGMGHLENCRELLLKFGRKAVADMKEHQLSREVETVMSLCSHHSGAQFAVGPLYLSHVLDEIMIGFEPVSRFLHGMIVGYGILVECIYVDRMDQFEELYSLFNGIGVPCCLKDLGIPDVTFEEVLEKCRIGFNKTMVQCSAVKLDPEKITEAVMKEDEIVRMKRE